MAGTVVINLVNDESGETLQIGSGANGLDLYK